MLAEAMSTEVWPLVLQNVVREVSTTCSRTRPRQATGMRSIGGLDRRVARLESAGAQGCRGRPGAGPARRCSYIRDSWTCFTTLEQDGRLYGQGSGRFMLGSCAGVRNIAEDWLEEEAVEHFCLVIRGKYRLVAAEAEVPIEP